METLLAADIGGTKTLLQLSQVDGAIILQQRFENDDYADFETLLSTFFSLLPTDLFPVSSACFAVAAPLTGQSVRLTNRAWVIDSERLMGLFPLASLQLVNDFFAVGHGIVELKQDDLRVLQNGQPEEKRLRAVIGAGTGLGQAVLSPVHSGWRVWSTEGGHTDFAPQDALQQQILSRLFQQYSHVSYERLLSGDGIQLLYRFVSEQEGVEVPAKSAQQISASALDLSDPLAVKAMRVFMQIYGAQGGNLALTTLPTSGLFIAGGIALRNVPLFEQPYFMEAFLAKGRMQGVLERIPVYLITHPEVGLLGARLLAQKALYNVRHDR